MQDFIGKLATLYIGGIILFFISLFKIFNSPFYVLTVDTTQPVLTSCHTDIVTIAQINAAPVRVTFTDPTAMDNSVTGSLSVATASHMSGDLYPLGHTPVIFGFCDSAMNCVECAFQILVTEGR